MSPHPKPDLSSIFTRVFRRDGWFCGVFKGAIANRLVRSKDGLHWEHWPHNPLIEIGEEHGEFARIRHVALMIRELMLYVFYSSYTNPERGREGKDSFTIPANREVLSETCSFSQEIRLVRVLRRGSSSASEDAH